MGSHYKIRTEKTGHYFMHGTVTSETKYVWICLHGYGELGKYFIRHFEFLDPSENLVIVPEGMNRYYTDEKHERVAAHWMTREDRLDEIADYVLFLEALRSKLTWDKNSNLKVIYFGFSQGVTTLIRWLTAIQPRADYILMWAGGIPDDIVFDHSRLYFEKINSHYFIGDKDRYLNNESMQVMKKLLAQTGMKTEIHSFAGDHRIDDDVLKNWVQKNINPPG
ncbi:MAG: hypothetical protein IPP15_02025 [Saprospiraceae bacterium]|uniref:Phospholipase/carboxylesterase/thioesterase domain-containing protein n=1 Tax=Candidatus Opimibacter skivensis TaxID=2982028 RepID=A0A9D7SQG3_9BACT|nr:hypothetical protein [Candidatus Opimibacter skivensis]